MQFCLRLILCVLRKTLFPILLCAGCGRDAGGGEGNLASACGADQLRHIGAKKEGGCPPRAGMLDVIRQEYIRTAYAKGLPASTVIFKHAFRNTFIIMITLFAGILPGLVGGSIMIEYIFDIPGMGTLSMSALNSRDLPLMMGLFSFTGFLTLTSILIADVLYVLADPRITFRSRI